MADTIKSSQKEYFKQEYEALQRENSVSASSRLASLSPEFDSDALIRCNSPLKQTEFLPYDIRFSLTMPRYSPVTKLIVRSCNEEIKHSAGTNRLLSMLPRIFWVAFRQEIMKKCTNHCIISKKNVTVPVLQLMAPLSSK